MGEFKFSMTNLISPLLPRVDSVSSKLTTQVHDAAKDIFFKNVPAFSVRTCSSLDHRIRTKEQTKIHCSWAGSTQMCGLNFVFLPLDSRGRRWWLQITWALTKSDVEFRWCVVLTLDLSNSSRPQMLWCSWTIVQEDKPLHPIRYFT